jgi:thioesterase domain-containing protein/acyl carrier protein
MTDRRPASFDPEFPSILAAVGEAWRETVPRDPFSEDRELADTGIDSLKAMELVLRLERRLGRKIGYELLTPTTTPASLAAGIVEGTAGHAGAHPFYFMTGLGGHQLRMVQGWRNRLAGVDFVLVDAPALEQSEAVLTDLSATAALVAAELSARQPEGPFRIGGYSFGGALAYEVARHLQAEGRAVALLALIDVLPPHDLFGRLGALLGAPSALPRLIAKQLFAVRRRLMAIPNRGDAEPDAASADREAIHRLRLTALRGWAPTPLDVQTVLAVTTDGLAAGAPRYWRGYLPNLQIVTVPGTHEELTAGAPAEQLVTALQDLLGARPSRH